MEPNHISIELTPAVITAAGFAVVAIIGAITAAYIKMFVAMVSLTRHVNTMKDELVEVTARLWEARGKQTGIESERAEVAEREEQAQSRKSEITSSREDREE